MAQKGKWTSMYCMQGVWIPHPPPVDKTTTTRRTDLRNKNLIKNIFVCFINISTIRHEIKCCFSLSIGPNQIVQQENNNILGEVLVSLFPGFVNPFPYLFLRPLCRWETVYYQLVCNCSQLTLAVLCRVCGVGYRHKIYTFIHHSNIMYNHSAYILYLIAKYNP